MTQSFPKIKGNFNAYESFRRRKKPLKSNGLTLAQEKPKPGQKPRNRCVGEQEIKAGLPDGDCKIHADVSVADRSRYSARIFADYFDKQQPCLRFCSWGRHFLNPEMGKGLPNRAIPAPHFHRVDKHGIMQAYRTPALEDEQQVKNVESGINLFCQESNVTSPDGTSVVVKVNTEALGLSMTDPSQDINFYP